MDDKHHKARNAHHLPWWTFFLVLGTIGLSSLISDFLFNSHFPKALNDEFEHPDKFLGGKAFKFLDGLTKHVRVTGTYENEVFGYEYLLNEVKKIQSDSHASQLIEIDHQVVSGSYQINFWSYDLANVYRNVQNLVVRLHGSAKTSDSLMFNCHFDSVPGSPGASDDAANCAIMMEVLRVLSRAPQRLKYSIIFLFNGAEETPLQASHGFITQHKWAKDIKTFVNLESCGSGGKEMLFQAGPNRNQWLIKMYSHVPHPSAQVAAEEIFQSGIIPSDTDFRIFRDFGHVPGLDFAHNRNGYRYHTKYDNINFLTPEFLQRTGDNALVLARVIANSDELPRAKELSAGNTVYFDILGLVFVYFSADFGAMLNIALCIVAVVVPFLSWSRVTRASHMKYLLRSTMFGCLFFVISMLVAFICCFHVVAPFLDKTGHSMSWYGTPIFATIIYGSVSLAVMLATYDILHGIVASTFYSPISLGLTVQTYLNGVNIVWSTLIWLSLHFGYRFGYGVAFGLFITLVTNTTIILTKKVNSLRAWVILHFLGQIFVVIWTTFIVNMVVGAFISILGRMGGDKNPDQLIGCLICAGTILVCSYLLPLVLLLRGRFKYYMILLGVCFVTVAIITSTGVGFPYKAPSHDSEPRVQRHYVTHTLRTFYDQGGHIRHTDSGYFFRVIDRNTHRTLKNVLQTSKLIDQLDPEFCRNETYCGIPTYHVRQIDGGGYWLPGPRPTLTHVNRLQQNSVNRLSPTERVYNFTLTENVCSVMVIRPNKEAGIELTDWDLTPVNPQKPLSQASEMRKGLGFPVLIQHGLKDRPKLSFTLKLTANEPFDGAWLDILLVTHHWEYSKEFTPEYKKLLQMFPDWAYTVSNVANVDGYKF
ncbi:endoplasmic reticulum metallopeptidase 1-like [Culicoides brevitarsis]|uniref:endoplasmic reticulum metallopeptidase 1-like n=1 Tax=Culicoides brevitarsis TaxID=469753 RepID=UPI00307B68CB